MKLYEKPLAITYHANAVSCASLWAVVYFLCLIILPYAATYGLGGMWTREVIVREQPYTRFRYEALVEAYGTRSAGTVISSWAWSTSPPINDLFGSRLRPMSLQAWEEDDELDKRPDRLQFRLIVPLDRGQDERLLQISVLVGVDVEFHRYEFDLRLNSSLHFHTSSPMAGRTWNQTADLAMLSDEPMRSRPLGEREPCNGGETGRVWAFRKPYSTSAAGILAQYNDCNDTAVLVQHQPHWTPGLGSDTFEASLTIRVPALVLTRRPGVVETLKLGFVQYVALFIPIAALLHCLHGALFTTGVLAARARHPIKQHQF